MFVPGILVELFGVIRLEVVIPRLRFDTLNIFPAGAFTRSVEAHLFCHAGIEQLLASKLTVLDAGGSVVGLI